MKAITTTALLFLSPKLVSGIVCSADNVLRALRANAPKASHFCSTYTSLPPNQPLPTYISQYPASRVSSGCTCLITPTAPPYPCQSSGEFIKDGDFQLVSQQAGTPGVVTPWEFYNSVNGQNTRASLLRGSDGNNNASLKIENSASGGFGSTKIRQPIPALCHGPTYYVTYDYQITVVGGGPGRDCRLEVRLDDQQLLVLNGIESDTTYVWTQAFPFEYSGTASAQGLTFQFSCSAFSGQFIVDNVRLLALK